jgi:chromosome segregation ATPase
MKPEKPIIGMKAVAQPSNEFDGIVYLTTEVNLLRKALADSEQKIKELQEAIDFRDSHDLEWDKTVKKQEQKIKELETLVESFRNDVKPTHNLIEKLQKQIAEKDKEIAELKSNSRDFWKAESIILKERIRELEKENKELYEQIGKVGLERTTMPEIQQAIQSERDRILKAVEDIFGHKYGDIIVAGERWQKFKKELSEPRKEKD